MNKWIETIRIIVKEREDEELTATEREMLDDAKCYFWMYPLLCEEAEKKIKRREKMRRKGKFLF